MRLVQCARCLRVCAEDDFGMQVDEDGCESGCCSACNCDSFYCVNGEGKRCSMSEHTQSPEIPHEFPSLKAYQEWLNEWRGQRHLLGEFTDA